MKNELSKSNEEILKLQTLKKSLEEENDQLAQLTNDQLLTISDLNDRNVENTQLLNEKEAELISLTQTVDSQREEITTLETSMQQYEDELKALQEERSSLQEQYDQTLNDLDLKTNECFDLRSEIMKLIRENTLAQESAELEIGSFRDQLVTQRQHYSQLMDELHQRIDVMTARGAEQTAEIAELNVVLKNEQSRAVEEIERLRLEVEGANVTIMKLKEEKTNGNELNAFLLQQIANLKAEAQRLETEKIESINTKTSSEIQLKNIISAQTKSLNSLNEEHQSLQSMYKSSQDEIVVCRNEVSSLTVKLDDLQSRFASLSDEKSHLSLQLSNSLSKISTLEDNLILSQSVCF